MRRTSSASVCPQKTEETHSVARSRGRLLITLTIQLMLAVGHTHAADNTPVVGPRVRVSPPLAGNHSLLDLSLDPDHPSDRFACGYRYSAPENAMLGFVYLSSDGGRSWGEVLKDSSSAWVSEESCAAGGGRVFFMAERALLEHGQFLSGLPLQQRGEIHLHSSSDGGKTWDSLVKRGWLDHTAMAVDWTHGAHRGRMYLFGQAARQVSSGYLDEIQLITSDDGKTLHGPVVVPLATTADYVAGYASSAKVLPDGSVLAAYLVRRKRRLTKSSAEDEAQAYVEVLRTSNGGQTIDKQAEFGPIDSCLGAMPALDVNRANGTVYLVWGSMQQNGCELVTSFTRDEGVSWSEPRVIVENGSVPEIAVNERGIVGLLWLETGESQCWRFAASSDGGQTFSDPVRISRCLPSSPITNLSQSARDASPEVHSQTTGSGWNLETTALGFSVIAAKDGLIPDRTGLTTDPAGVFHAVWPEPTDDGALWSASITVGSAETTLLPDAARDVSSDVVLEFANPEFDPASGVYALDVTITNVTAKPVAGHLFLRLDRAFSRYFKAVTAIGSDNDASLGRPLWAVWAKGRTEILNPGETSSPRRLSFLLKQKYCDEADFGDLLSVRLTAFLVPAQMRTAN
jgi:hypothetical protein